MTRELNFFESEIETISSNSPLPPISADLEVSISSTIPTHPGTTTSTMPVEQEASTEISETTDGTDWIQIDQQLRHHIKRVIEALLFASPDPLPLTKIREVTETISPLRPRQLRQILNELKQEYLAQQRAFQLEEIAQGYVLRSYEEYAPYVDLLYRQKRWEKLSHASTEVLAIIAYRQPITRPQIDAIRGVDSSGSLMQLLERQLIEPTGKLEAPGRPTIYGTTKEFLKHFGLKDLEALTSSH